MAQAARTKSSSRAKKTASKKSTTSRKRRTEPQASEYAKEAVSEWGNAVRYAVEAAGPVAKRARERFSERWSDRLSHSRLRDQLNPAKTEKGGRIGDAADSMLEKLGTPGKLASKASLGSRVVDKFLPDQADDDQEPESATSKTEDTEAERAADNDADGVESQGERKTRQGTTNTVPDPAKAPAQVAPPPTGGRTGAEDPEEAEFEYERDYAARHDHLPPNAYPEITH
jgi:hypothetical protein